VFYVHKMLKNRPLYPLAYDVYDEYVVKMWLPGGPYHAIHFSTKHSVPCV